VQYKASAKIYNILSCCSKSPSHFYLYCCYLSLPTNGRLKFEAYFWALVKIHFMEKWNIHRVSPLVTSLHWTGLSEVCGDFLVTFPGANTTKAMRDKCKNQNFHPTFYPPWNPKHARSWSPKAKGERIHSSKYFNCENFIQQHLNTKPRPRMQARRPNNNALYAPWLDAQEVPNWTLNLFGKELRCKAGNKGGLKSAPSCCVFVQRNYCHSVHQIHTANWFAKWNTYK